MANIIVKLISFSHGFHAMEIPTINVYRKLFRSKTKNVFIVIFVSNRLNLDDHHHQILIMFANNDYSIGLIQLKLNQKMNRFRLIITNISYLKLALFLRMKHLSSIVYLHLLQPKHFKRKIVLVYINYVRMDVTLSLMIGARHIKVIVYHNPCAV